MFALGSWATLLFVLCRSRLQFHRFHREEEGIIIYEQDLRDAIYPLNEKRVMGAETRWLIRFNRQVMDRRNTMGETARRWPLKGSGVRSFSSVATIRYYKPATDFRIQPVETSTNLLGNLD